MRVDSVSSVHDKDSVELLPILEKSLNHDISKEEFEKNHKKMESWIQKHSFYTKDSIELKLNNHKDYSFLLDFVSSLKHENIDKVDNNKIILGGTSFYIYISKDNKLEEKILIHPPSKDNYPLISRLINKSLDLYKLNHSNSFLDNK